MFIQEFLNDRTFKVAVNWTESGSRHQEEGVPQGSILSVALFAIKINSLATVIPANIHTSLFVDDLQIAYQDYRMTDITTKLQNTIDNSTAWATRNGFKFSKTKTVCMKFYTKSEPITNPALKLQTHDIPVVQTTKFLGLIRDNKIT